MLDICVFVTYKKDTPKCPQKAYFGGIIKTNAMAKVQNISEITPKLPFSEYDFYDLYKRTFEMSELGRIKVS